MEKQDLDNRIGEDFFPEKLSRKKQQYVQGISFDNPT